MLKDMREQALMAIEMADVVMFVVDVRQGGDTICVIAHKYLS